MTALTAGHHAELDDVGRRFWRARLAAARLSNVHPARRAAGCDPRRRPDRADRRPDLVRRRRTGHPVDDGFVQRTVDLVLAGQTAATDARWTTARRPPRVTPPRTVGT